MSVPNLTETEKRKLEAFGFDGYPTIDESMQLGRVLMEDGKGKRDARDDFHLECHCIPDLGPSHCHACTVDPYTVVAWWRALEFHAEMAVHS